MDYPKLTAALTAAKALAQEAVKGMSDNGTCNSDSVFLPTGKDCPIARKSKKAEDAIQAAGMTVFHKGYGWRRGYIIHIGVGGQGATRTLAAEAVCKHLAAEGFEASMWYQMD